MDRLDYLFVSGQCDHDCGCNLAWQPALTAEYKLNLLSPATGERLICRARVIKPGRQVAVVAADVFCVSGGIEKHTATALASIAMLDETARAKMPSPA